jgi:hypothetical protein
MAAVVKVLADWQDTGSPVREMVVTLAGDSNYPTGGYLFSTAQGVPAPLNGTLIFAEWEVLAGAAGSQTWVASTDYVNAKVKVSRDNGELAGATNVSTLSLRGRLLFKVA